MILDIEADRLAVASDLHLGSPVSTATRRIVPFLDQLTGAGIDVCLDGDAVDLVQAVPAKLASDARAVRDAVERLADGGAKVYVVAGNHDPLLRDQLRGWAVTAISPFLNVRSGGRRIRIEHGHVYDPFFIDHEPLYEALCRASRHAARLVPDVYRSMARWQSQVARLRRSRGRGDPYERAAAMLLARGFDAVVMGHTHQAACVDLPEGRYLNTGNWAHGSTYVLIDRGRATLHAWTAGAAPAIFG